MAKVAVVLADDFEDSEYAIPSDRLRDAGHRLEIVGSHAGVELSGKRGNEVVRVDVAARDADPGGYDLLLIPGGYSPDHLRMDPDVVAFVRQFVDLGKPIAAVCHGPQLLIEAEAVRGRTVTSWPSVRTDLRNAGANWVDREVVEDGNLVTSRKPDDLEAFSAAVLGRLSAAAA